MSVKRPVDRRNRYFPFCPAALAADSGLVPRPGWRSNHQPKRAINSRLHANGDPRSSAFLQPKASAFWVRYPSRAKTPAVSKSAQRQIGGPNANGSLRAGRHKTRCRRGHAVQRHPPERSRWACPPCLRKLFPPARSKVDSTPNWKRNRSRSGHENRQRRVRPATTLVLMCGWKAGWIIIGSVYPIQRV